ncbi:MAG: Peptidoglycan-binding LysM [Parcubacteria group bacterium GW2011_GWC2_45_7]|nr:MAG: Peptidoglycan-binding LysM [Parcubacteria group bacterium GW2011_GWC2_45_7]KKU74020.1 MAG: Peptidoglycan-binding LysM [Parcubacteria group bacterium GW2011_GWA2_47_26]
MQERIKRIILIIGFIIISTAIGFGIWWFFFRPIIAPPAAPEAVPPAVPPTVGLPPALPAPPRPTVVTPAATLQPSPLATGGLTQTTALTTFATLTPSISSDGSSVNYYNRSDGKFYRIRPDGTLEPLSDRVFFNVSNVTWAPDRNQAVLEYPDGSNIVYNFETERATTLPSHWQQFNFSPRSEALAFLSVGIDEDSRWLATANNDGSGTRPIEPLGNNADKVQVAWSPNDQIIAFSRTGTPRGLNEQEILMVGKQGENFPALVANGIGFRGRFSPDGERLLYSATSGDEDWKPLLWIAGATPDTIGQGKTPLGLNTWVDKCTFGSDEIIYCAVPTELPRGAGLYPTAVGNTPDNLYRVNLRTGERSLIAIPSEDHTINNIVVSDDERILYFTDSISGQLYRVNLR